jgi:dienelactone hydrolase
MTSRLADEDVVLAEPERPCGTGVLVLHGSSGRLEADRARLLARHGAHALAIRWIGGVGQPSDPYEVPLELFSAGLDRLAARCDRLAVLGLSFGAEAALLTGVHDSRVDAVVAFAPSPVAWAGFSGGRMSSHWSLRGEPVPFMPFLVDGEPTGDPPAFRGLYEASLAADPARAAQAAIPVERISGDVVLVGGEDDQVWPGADFARLVARRRDRHGLASTVVVHPGAGHRVVLPGEEPARGGMKLARGGSERADRELGQLAWPHLRRVLRLH